MGKSFSFFTFIEFVWLVKKTFMIIRVTNELINIRARKWKKCIRSANHTLYRFMVKQEKSVKFQLERCILNHFIGQALFLCHEIWFLDLCLYLKWMLEDIHACFNGDSISGQKWAPTHCHRSTEIHKIK